MKKSFDVLLPPNFSLPFSKRRNRLLFLQEERGNQYINPFTFPFTFFAQLLLAILQFGYDLSIIQQQNDCMPHSLNASIVNQHK